MQNTRTYNRINSTTTAYGSTRTKSRATARQSPYLRLAKKIGRRIRGQVLLYMCAFYLLPTVFSESVYTLLLTLVFPIVCFVLSTAYGMRFGFISHYLTIPIIIFIPASFAFFAKFSFLYSICYLFISLIALTYGAIVRQMSR